MIDFLVNEEHFRSHTLPIWRALPESIRGTFIEPENVTRLGIADAHPERAILVASYRGQFIARRAGYRKIARIEHGIGQSYSGNQPSYAGGRDADDASLFLCPNEHSADRWRRAYPSASVVIVGSPKLDTLPNREFLTSAYEPVVCISFHPPTYASGRASGLDDFRGVLPALAKAFTVIGHAHPRAGWPLRMRKLYRNAGIEFVADFEEVCRRADLYVADNTSTLFEFASTGRPVVVLNARRYHRGAHHGLRFWEAAEVGINVWPSDDLVAAVTEALRDPPERKVARESALSIVYAHRSGAAVRAASALMAWIGARAVAGLTLHKSASLTVS